MCGRSRSMRIPSPSVLSAIDPSQTHHSNSTTTSTTSTSSATASSTTPAYPVVDLEKFQCHENITPGHYIPAIKWSYQTNQLETRLMRWGLCRSWEKQLTNPFRVFNARSESLTEKAMFYQLLTKQRCVVPMNGFYEFRDFSR